MAEKSKEHVTVTWDGRSVVDVEKALQSKKMQETIAELRKKIRHVKPTPQPGH